MSTPSSAELARTAVARARVAVLTTYPRNARSVLATVEVSDADGALLLRLPRHTLAAQTLERRPLGTVRLSPEGCETVTIQGAARRLQRADDQGLTHYRLDVGAVRVGERVGEPVDVDEYWAATADPLRDEAPAILDHLRHHHGADLTACVRAHGHTGVLWADPRRLDRYGLELSILDDAGANTLRLSFDRPVQSVAELSPGLAVLLRGPGGCGHRRAVQQPAEPDHRHQA
ncbi:DUF2470 domain-containing protein [Rhodococcus sp. X156]|uniref:DUF2470 domain-containing protein n=1 Tax=Rhodococcus sp. X156 TaxID=2499145 RepID=UPI0013E32EF2|nr:DUF2470 domain-containing protein [Rhodococcus sp. X156]